MTEAAPAELGRPFFADRLALHGALAAVVAAYATATGEPSFLAASVGSAMLYAHAEKLHAEHAREGAGECAITA